MIKVVITDDSKLLRDSLMGILNQNNNIEIVAVAGNGLEALEACRMYSPDVVLMDIRMPECDGIQGTKMIKSELPSIKIIILTTFEDKEYLQSALSYGAEGYILKDLSPNEITLAIESVVNDMPIMHHRVFDEVLKEFALNDSKKKKVIPQVDLEKSDELRKLLSDKEIQIIQHIVEGKGNKKIATELKLSEGRVRNIITEIFNKLKVKDRTQLAVFAVKNNLVE